jgi:hypothetical protein
MFSVVQSVPVSALGTHLTVDPEIFRSYFRHLDRDNLILLSAKLNLIVADGFCPNGKQNQELALRLLRQDGLVDTGDLRRLDSYLRKLSTDAIVISRPQIFEFLRWACVWAPVKGANFRWDNEARRAFLRALLMSYDLYSRREQEPALSPNKEEGQSIEQRRKNARKMMRLTALFAAPGRFPIIHAGRATALLLNHFFKLYPAYCEAFQQITELAPEEYVECNCAVMLSLLQKDKKYSLQTLYGAYEFSARDLYLNALHMKDVLLRYLKLESQTIDELASGFMNQQLTSPTSDFFKLKHVREKPLLTNGEKYIVLDQVMFAERASIGALFLLMRRYPPNQILQDFGNAFQEYVIELVRLFEERLPVESRSSVVREPPGRKASASKQKRPFGDIYIGKAETAILIEAKGVFLADDALSETDPEKFWERIQKLYGVSTDKGVEKRKGIAQLADSIIGLARGELLPEGEAESLSTCKTIFPVLVVHDGLMSAPFFARSLCEDFCEILGVNSVPESGFFSYESLRVSAPIVLTIWDLELLESVSGSGSMAELFEEYVTTDWERNANFSDFLFGKIRKGLFKRNLSHASKLGSETLNRIALKFFGARLADE